MLYRILSSWFWFRSNRPGFFLGSALLLLIMLLLYSGGIQASLSLGPGGDFPRVQDLFFYAFSHDELPSLVINIIFLLLLGPRQEQRWGTVAFLALSILSIATLPLFYTIVLCIGGGEASRISGYSAPQLALFTAQCRQVTQRRVLRWVPVWFLPWLLLLFSLLLLPNTPALLHFCAICIGHNYSQSFIEILQEQERNQIFDLIPNWACFRISTIFRLPTYTSSQRSESLSETISEDQVLPSNHPTSRDPCLMNQQPWMEPGSAWSTEASVVLSEAQLLEEQMLRVGILASLQDTAEDPDTKVEVPKSSVSSLRLQQLERMGFPTEKAVVALAASKQLDGAISLLIDDRVGEQAVVVSKGKSLRPPQEKCLRRMCIP
ncbi:rhomboid domain-containing protein 3 [Lampris incognitus]|uniref:rhomboid domain-containing protein 3 n=1 Tax=Lampris incognitus TaxID=2546036 RepID=UPI0024B61604|nr:rhomboid domain-containing protein 3 [Lampris incognitus]